MAMGLALLTASTALAQAQRAAQPASKAPAGLPTAADWREHLEKDLMTFWLPAQTTGVPGDFLTYRCNDGKPYNRAAPCEELANPSYDGIVYLDREYLRMKSRQVYGYGVAYHVTGDPKYLELARQGAQFMMKRGFDKAANGKLTPISFWTRTPKGFVAGPTPPQRTSQDMAYSLTGLGFYYYLTRDPEALRYIRAVKDTIFETYYDEGQRMIRWVNENYREETTDRVELTAQLDQVYAYMIWLTRALPPEDQPKWFEDLKKVAYIMKNRFYQGPCAEGLSGAELQQTQHDTGCDLFWGDMTQGHRREVGPYHTDYGHSVKTMWMIYTVGKLTKDKTLEDFGRDGATRILKTAYNQQTKSWDRAPKDQNKEWWALCELDQTAGSLALSDPSYANVLPDTWRFWKQYMVDNKDHEIWHVVNLSKEGTWVPDTRVPKQHSWKNMMHTTEHALVGYITSGALYGEPVKLHFAWKRPPPQKTIHPYVYEATIQSIEESPGRQVVTFSQIH
jgi:mannose/cellobiose epimerase-like protein (N-acyl-D-glucosamine 2-epimerase family)